MTPEEFDRAIEIGVEIVDMVHDEGSNVVSFGEMGIANTLFFFPVDDLPDRYSFERLCRSG